MIKFGLYTQDHDLSRKIKQGIQFIEKGHSVRFRMEVRGRSKYVDNADKHYQEHIKQLLSPYFKMITVSGTNGNYDFFTQKLNNNVPTIT